MNEMIQKQLEFDKENKWDWSNLDLDNKIRNLQYLVVALSEEVGEIAGPLKKMLRKERFDQKITEEDFNELREKLKEEIADVQIYLIKLAQVLNLDIAEEHSKKIEINRTRMEEFRNGV